MKTQEKGQSITVIKDELEINPVIIEENKSKEDYIKENEELKEAISWLMDCYKRTLGSQSVRNLDEVFSYAESLIRKDK